MPEDVQGPYLTIAPADSRWTAEPGKDIPRTAHGLLDIEQIAHSWYSGDRPDRGDELIGADYSYVLLAPGGSGKSTLIDELREKEPGSAAIDLRMHDRESLKAEIAAVSAHAQTCVVDALDEALQVDPNLGYVLVKLFASDDARRVRWRLACRPASWSLELASGLRSALPGLRELELLPLDMNGVRIIAGKDADAFVAAVEQEHLTRLLGQPLNVHALLRQWSATGTLPASRSDAMDHSVKLLLSESGTFRPARKQNHARMRLVAERLAVTTMLSSVGRYTLGDQSAVSSYSEAVIPQDRAAIAVTAVPMDAEPDLGRPLELDDVREVLGTSLFSAAGDGCVAFAHQSYAEFLAAHYLVRRGVSGRRLAAVLGADTNGLAPGPMIEVLGWMLALDADVPGELIQHNAKQLLKTSGIELASGQVRARVVDAIFRGLAEGTVDEGWGIDLSVLAHPHLGEQLHDAAQAATNSWEIFWIARIAMHCLVFDATDDLIALAMTSSWPSFVRSLAVHAFAAVAPVDRIYELEPLLNLDASEDPDDEILAAALRALLQIISDNRLATAIRLPRRGSLIGGYYSLLGELPTLLGAGRALPLLLETIPKLDSNSSLAFGRLINGLLMKAWQEAVIGDATAIGGMLGRAHRLPESRFSAHQQFPWEIDPKDDLRLAVAASALKAGEHSFYSVLQLRLLTPTDLPWLADWMADAPASAVKEAEVVLRNLAAAVNDALTADFVLTVGPEHPAHAALSQFQGVASLEARPEWVTEVLSRRADGPSTAALTAGLRSALAEAQDDLTTWWKCAIALSDPGGYGGNDSVFSWDLTSRPLWAELDNSEREAFWHTALAYLDRHRPKPELWKDQQTWTLSDVMPDWAGVYVIATVAMHRQELLDTIPERNWNAWAPTLVAVPAFQGTDAWQPALLQLAPSACVAAITTALCDHIRGSSSTSFAYHHLANFEDPSTLAAIADVARDTTESPDRRDAAISILIKHSPTLALEISRVALGEVHPPASAAVAMASIAPEEFLAPRLSSGVAPLLEIVPRLDLEKLTDETLASLAGALLDHFPFKDDPDVGSADFSDVTSASEARRTRLPVLQALAARGQTARLRELATGRDPLEVEHIQHAMQQAREREALVKWRPLAPDTMMKVIASGDARLIRDSEDLQALVLEQLELIQGDLKTRALFRSVWDGEPGTPEASPKVEDDVSDWLAHELQLRLTPHVVVDREVQVTRRRKSGVGTRIDIAVTSPAGVRLGRVLFEAKRVENNELMSALGDQLVSQYMNPAGVSHGIYVVYWVAPGRRPKSWKRWHADPSVLALKLREQARSQKPKSHIEVMVLDIGPPP